MAWYAVYHTTTGVLNGVYQRQPAPMPAGHGSKQYDQKPPSNLYWDTTTKDYIVPAGV